ncbi:MAG TPA: hypothetical protein VJ802_12210 [Gemmatimonadaceae bacterium]|nr:hypothetical protein [Gemmatimonadaceae bacterium]
MSDQTTQYLIIAVAAILILTLAIVFGRRFMAKWGDKEISTGREQGMSQKMVARGKGSAIDRATMTGNATSGVNSQNMEAGKGGKLRDVHMNPEGTERKP